MAGHQGHSLSQVHARTTAQTDDTVAVIVLKDLGRGGDAILIRIGRGLVEDGGKADLTGRCRHGRDNTGGNQALVGDQHRPLDPLLGQIGSQLLDRARIKNCGVNDRQNGHDSSHIVVAPFALTWRGMERGSRMKRRAFCRLNDCNGLGRR